MGGGKGGKSSGKGSSKGGKAGKGAKGKKGEKDSKERKKDLGEGKQKEGLEAPAKDAKVTPDLASKGDEDESGSSSTRALVEALRSFSTPQWWLIGKSNGEDGEATSRRRQKPEEFRKMCSERHAEMRKVYEAAMSQDSEQRWLRKVSSEGTAGDKVASLTMLIQVCPVFATGYIKALLSMASKTARSDSMMALDALKDLFIGTLLPDRKLKTLQQMEPISSKGLRKATFTEICVVAFFEDYLKTAFAAFVQVLGEAGHNAVTFVKTKAIRTAHDLLSEKPEQEKALLALMVNKFGDSSPKVSSNVSHCLKQLLKAHPGMKTPLVKEVNAFLMRPNITQRSQYYAVLLLSELVMERNDGALAAELIRLFVARLEAALRKPVLSKKAAARLKKDRWQSRQKKPRGLSEEDNRLVRTLINGIRRAMPYLDAAGGAPLQEETVDALFKVCHTVTSFSTRISILSLLYRGLAVGDPPDRFYRLLYEQVSHFDLFSSTHRWQALLLLKGCIPSDISVARGVAMGRRLLQVGANLEPAVAVAALGVLKELFMARRPEVKPLLHSSESALALPLDTEGADAEEEHFVDDDVAGAEKAEVTEEVKRYDALAREPRFARARNTPLWELQALSCHIHPFVAQGASKLVKSETFEDAAGNPFDVFSVGELLEQFSYASKAQKDRTGTEKGKKKSKAVSFNPERFAQRKRVPPHEKFFQLYFKDDIVKQLQKEKRLRRRQKEEDFDEQNTKEDDGADENEEDAFFDEYLKGEDLGDGADVDDDEDGEDFDDPDMDDDDDADFGEGPDSEDEDEGSGGEDFDVAMGPGGTKRKASDEDLPQRDRIKAIKKKHAGSGSMFASIDDFQSLLDEDGLEYS